MAVSLTVAVDLRFVEGGEPMSTAMLDAASRFASGAVVWLNLREAVIARTAADRDRAIGESVLSIERGPIEPQASYLSRVVHELGDRERVVILGPGIARLELERSYSSIYQRPDRLVDVEPSGPVLPQDLLARLNGLCGDEDRDPA
jgi:hypothetical protein